LYVFLAQSPEMDNILNSPITIEEIKNVVKGLKNGKSSGIDGVINEHIKYTIDINYTINT
jgi:hypothetical protein